MLSGLIFLCHAPVYKPKRAAAPRAKYYGDKLNHGNKKRAGR